MVREHFDERQVGIFVGAFKYVVEISDRLVRVNQENQLEFSHLRTSRTLHRITRFPRTSGTDFAPAGRTWLCVRGSAYRACPSKLREAFAKPRHRHFYGRMRRTGRCVNYDKHVACGLGNHGTRRIADGAAEGTVRVGENGPSFQVPCALSDAFVALAGDSAAKCHWRVNPAAAATSKRPPGFDRADITDVNDVCHAIQPFPLDDAPDQRLGGR